MTRSKNFTREEVLEKSMPLFWRKGFASTSMRDIELGTGVNKSGLYSEFKDKEDMYLASLAFYTLTRGGAEILEHSPLGWDNIERLLLSVLEEHLNEKGCFMAFSMRDYLLFTASGKKNIYRQLDKMRGLIAKNVSATKSSLDFEQLTDIVLMFFSGLALSQNSDAAAHSQDSVKLFVAGLKHL
jgi:AcrR family transcriptional regulator